MTVGPFNLNAPTVAETHKLERAQKPAPSERRARPRAADVPIAPRVVAPFSPRTCQWIAGRPSADDACKCGQPVEEGRPYCAEHYERSIRRPEDVTQGERRAGRAA